MNLYPFEQKLNECLLRDHHRCRQQWQKIQQRQARNQPVDRLEEKLRAELEQSNQQFLQRQQSVPTISFPEELPVSQKRDDIAAAIRDNQVVIVAGETGSGKTTQLPKICLQLGLGVRGMIGHTQPRRIAARTVAHRIAEELKVSLGETVGYQVRFNDQSSPNSLLKLMTDGILLAEITADRFLQQYDTLIIDEAHERSLNIDFILGYLKQLLPQRPDLKVIITSATIDVERLSHHFNSAPIVQVSGRTYPVEVRYRPHFENSNSELTTDEPTADDLVSNIVATIDEIVCGEPRSSNGIDDILVFLAGEREIRETALAIRKAHLSAKNWGQLEVLPLYARLSLSEQEKVFKGRRGRRVVLATNVAETSITVPGIRYVIDPGYARISRYSYRTKVLRLPIEAISQASANQRQGRCGRVSNGICYRLYSEEDFNNRPEFTEPEILRSNLASVILQMAQLRLGDINDFPFVDSPDKRLVSDGYKLLEEIKALDKNNHLTDIGRQLTQFSVDPRYARIILAAVANNCLREILIIVSGLTVQDPRERPADKQQAADEKHRRFWDENSDFLAFVNLWNYIEQQRQDLSQSQLRKLCQREFLSFLRLREWRDLHHQLRLAAKHANLKENKEPATYEEVHRALLAGLLSNIGQLDVLQDQDANRSRKDKNKSEGGGKPPKGSAYLGPRNRKFFIFPGSSQFKKQPTWLVAAELIETTKLYAHTDAKVETDWVLATADHLVKRQYSEPHYESRRGQVLAFERVTLYGLTLVEKRRVNFSDIDATLARDIFIREALVEGRYKPEKAAAFQLHNQTLLEEALELEAKARRRDLLVNDEALVQFFDERIPADVVNNKSFDAWRKQAERKNPQLLFLPRSLVIQSGADDVTVAQFPNELAWQNLSFPLSYHFEPSHQEDGVSIHVPLQMLHLVPENRLQWLVPGLLREKCIAIVKSLPKQWRKHWVPVPETVDAMLPTLQADDVPLHESIARWVAKQRNVVIPAQAWEQISVDPYYVMNIKVLDDKGRCIDNGRSLADLRQKYRDRLQQSLRHVGESVERDNISAWDFDTLPENIELKRGSLTTVGFPALVQEGDNLKLQVQEDLDQALFLSQRGVAHLLLLEQKQSTSYLKKNLFRRGNDELRLAFLLKLLSSNQLVQIPNAQLWEEVVCAAAQQLRLQYEATFQRQGTLVKGALVQDTLVKGTLVQDKAMPTKPGALIPRSKDQFQQLLQFVQPKLIAQAQSLEKFVLECSDQLAKIYRAMSEREQKPAFADIRQDIESQLCELFSPHFLFYTSPQWLQQYSRYLSGIEARIARADAQIHKDAEKRRDFAPYWDQLLNFRLPKGSQQERGDWGVLFWQNSELETYRWMLEEFRLSLFAQPMKTIVPVSAKRLDAQWQLLKEGDG